VSVLRAVLNTLLREDFLGIRSRGSIVDGFLRFELVEIRCARTVSCAMSP